MPVGAIIGGSVIGAGASIISGNKAANAQQEAAAKQEQTANKSLDIEKYIYDTTRADNEPSRLTGQNAMFKLADMYGVARPGGPANPTANYSAFEKSPGYEFRMKEGMNALQSSAAARGKLLSGTTLKGITDYAQGRASDEFNSYTNALRSIAGLEQTANTNNQNAGNNYASGASNALAQVGSSAINSGNARASSYANTGSSINAGIQNGLTAYLYSKSPVLFPQTQTS